MIRYSVFCLSMLFALPGGLFAQSNTGWCDTDRRLEEHLNAHPEAREHMEEQEQIIQSLTNLGQRDENDDRIVIPTVVHIIHDNGIGNISDAQVHDGIRVLNEDYQLRNEDRGETRDIFQDVAGCANFEFRLARLDPDGNPTNGIVRVSAPNETYNTGDNAKDESWWPGVDYFNIWIVNSIDNNGQSGTILGYAYLPSSNPQWNAGYGVIMRHDQFGTIGTSNANGRTLTHEVGHSFNLRHTFQGGCGGNCSSTGDFVCDTPPAFEDTYDCIFSQNTCSTDNIGPNPFGTDVVDMIENYMSYDDCQNIVTEGQVSRMRAAVQTISQLSQLTSDANLAETGVDQLYAVDFYSYDRIVCVGNSTQFHDATQYGSTEWAWQFPGAYPSESEQANPTITYVEPGLYDVVLTASSGGGTMSELKSDFMLVVPSLGRYTPWVEGFEDDDFPNASWASWNHDELGYKWERTADAAYSGTHSLRMNNFGNQDGAIDELVSTTIDLSNLESAELTFKYAYAQRTASDQDVIRFLVSTDCGENWYIRWAGSGANMATAAVNTSNFVPSGASEWEEVNVTISSSLLVENFLMKFEFESNQGNNFYLDDLNIGGVFNPVPMHVSPADGSTGVADAVTLDWKAVGEVDNYAIQLDTTPLFFSPELLQETKAYINIDPNNADTELDASGLLHSTTYYWRVRSQESGVWSDWSDPWQFTISDNGVGFDEPTPQNSSVSIYPNPISDASVIEVNLTEPSLVSIQVFDITGQLVDVISAESLQSGTIRYDLQKNNFKSGVYLARVQINTDIRVSKFLVK